MSRAIPDDNLAYPVLVTVVQAGSGSGFFLNTPHSVFFVTAKHVLFDPNSGSLAGSTCSLLSYAHDPKETAKNELHLDLQQLSAGGHLLSHSAADVAVVKIGTVTDGKVTTLVGVKVIATAPLGIIGVASESVKSFADVLVANEVFIFGYPTSLGLKNIPQIDYTKPLLRKGIIAGKNEALGTLILDCPVYQGNSGGPVLEVESEGVSMTRFKVVGVISQFVPLVETWRNETQGYQNIDLSNSGYSVASPMDSVMELVSVFTSKTGSSAG